MNEQVDYAKYNIFKFLLKKDVLVDNSTQEYINERMKEFAMNIADFSIGQTIIDVDKKECEIVDMTKNSIQVSIKRKTKNGIDSLQWFDMREFNKRFKAK